MRHLYPEHLTAEATSSIGSCCALSYSAVVLELVSLNISRWLHLESLLPVEHLQKLFGNEEAKKTWRKQCVMKMRLRAHKPAK